MVAPDGRRRENFAHVFGSQEMSEFFFAFRAVRAGKEILCGGDDRRRFVFVPFWSRK